MTSLFIQTLESRALLCGEGSVEKAPEAAAAMAVPLAYTYPDGYGEPGGNTSGGGNNNAAGGTGDTPAGKPRTFKAKINGASEVPARTTRASGNAEFILSKNGRKINFTVTVSKLRNVVDAHLHLGPKGQNGGVVVHLLGPFAPSGGVRNGRLVRGTITGNDLEGALAGQKLGSLVKQLRAKNIYINIHTSDGQGASDTGPGDFASGEIRGQLNPQRKRA